MRLYWAEVLAGIVLPSNERRYEEGEARRYQTIPMWLRGWETCKDEANESKNEKDETNNRRHCPILSIQGEEKGRKQDEKKVDHQ